MELISWRWRWKWWSWSECTHWHTANSRAKEKKVKANKTLRPSLFIDPTTLELICLFAINWSQLAMTLLPFTHGAQWKKKKALFAKSVTGNEKSLTKHLDKQTSVFIHSFVRVWPALSFVVVSPGRKLTKSSLATFCLFVCWFVCLARPLMSWWRGTIVLTFTFFDVYRLIYLFIYPLNPHHFWNVLKLFF